MKITKIEQQGNIFIVTRSPNLVQKFFGLKIKVKKYRDTGVFYHHFECIRVYTNQKGDILGPIHKMTKILENWRRRF